MCCATRTVKSTTEHGIRSVLPALPLFQKQRQKGSQTILTGRIHAGCPHKAAAALGIKRILCNESSHQTEAIAG